MKEITPTQRIALKAIHQFMKNNGYSPTMVELAKLLSYASPNAAQQHVDTLKGNLYISVKPSSARSIVLTDKGLQELGVNSNWISVKDKLPNDETNYYGSVLVYCVYKACKECDVAYLNDDNFFASEESHKEIIKLTMKWEKATKRCATTAGNIKEFLKRAQASSGTIPDDILTSDMRGYRVWLMEPFMERKWEPYKPANSREVFIDGVSASKGFLKVIDDEIETDKKETQTNQ